MRESEGFIVGFGGNVDTTSDELRVVYKRKNQNDSQMFALSNQVEAFAIDSDEGRLGKNEVRKE